MKTFPTLYKQTATGATQMWYVGVDGNKIIVSHGQVNGKISTNETVIKNGKNIGRSNQTTPEQQALAEATSKWEGKIKKGYVEDVQRARKGEKDIVGGYDCMLAHKFVDHGHKIVYPADVQPKLNGHRCLAIIDNGVASLWSRTRKPITSCPHIIEELVKIFPVGYTEIDGELYNHAYKDKFEDLASLIRQEAPASNCSEIQYHVYDMPTMCVKGESKGFHERIRHLYDRILLSAVVCSYIVKVVTHVAENEEELMFHFDTFLRNGYEGVMVRNKDSKYQGKRSYDLQKIKEFLDADYPIVGITEGRGGCSVFICETPAGALFNVKMRGSKERLAEFLKVSSMWQGKELVVKYQYISKYGIPIFPIGERFKE